jgi:hypothetical protein
MAHEYDRQGAVHGRRLLFCFQHSVSHAPTRAIPAQPSPVTYSVEPHYTHTHTQNTLDLIKDKNCSRTVQPPRSPASAVPLSAAESHQNPSPTRRCRSAPPFIICWLGCRSSMSSSKLTCHAAAHCSRSQAKTRPRDILDQEH